MTKPTSQWILVRTPVMVALVFLLFVATNTGDRGEIEPEEAHRISESALKVLANAEQPKSLVDLKFSYGKRKSFRGSASDRTVLINQQAVYGIVGKLKEQIAMPFEIQVIFEECGGPDSYYDEYSHEIVICYELIDTYSELFSRTLKTRSARDEATKGAVVSMFLHEVAHALIAGWNLPITGREEDAADQFSTLMLINEIAEGDEMALHGARSFKLLADLEKNLNKDYSGPHSLDEQRFFNTICLVYGRRPERYESLIRNGTLPEARAFECERDYARVNKSWQTLLAPYLSRSNNPEQSRKTDITSQGSPVAKARPR